MSRRPTPALENAKREAKRWLKALRDGVDEARARLERVTADAPAVPSLRPMQLALARERGFTGWNALKEALTAERRRALTLEHFEKIAADLVDAYDTGRAEAMQSVWRHFGHMRSWEGMRTYVQLDLGKRPSADGTQPDITLDDARLLTARAHGFPTWDALTELIESQSNDGATLVARPVTVFSSELLANTHTVTSCYPHDIKSRSDHRDGRRRFLHGAGEHAARRLRVGSIRTFEAEDLFSWHGEW